MPMQTSSTKTPMELLSMGDGLIIQQALYSAAKLGVADLLKDGPRTASELARNLQVNESALYRILRLLASLSVFEETSPQTFANTELSQFLRSGVPGSVRSILIFRGSELFFRPFAEILYSVRTGKSARTEVFGMDGWEYLRQHPEYARMFDDAMTDMSAIIGPIVAAAYDFGRWGNIMDVGGGNGILLASILKAHPEVRGVLADLPHVLERAQQRGFLVGELQVRSAMQPCDFFREVPSGCRVYVMKNVIHDWDDEHAEEILANCRRAIPADGALLLVEWTLHEGNLYSVGKLFDIAMLVLTGGKERTEEEYRRLLARAGFRLNEVILTPCDLSIIEAVPE
jgi:SAM-dependent methyltransferase